MGKRAKSPRSPAVPFRRGERISLQRRADAPDPTDIGAVRAWVGSRQGPTAVDLFCGAGGLSLGLERAGFEMVLGADSEPVAMETHGHNTGGLHWVGDLSDPTLLIEAMTAWGIAHVDLVAGGVPCQPFSRAGEARLNELAAAGLRDEVDPRAGLWQSFLSFVRFLEPRAVLVENVPDLARWNDGAVLTGLMNGLRDLGFAVDVRILRAADHGIPQHRARLFMVGLRESGRFDWPEPADHPVSLWEGIGDLPPVPGGHWDQRIRYLDGRQGSQYQRLMRAGLRGEDRWFVEDHLTREVRDDDHEAYGLLGEGQTYSDLPPHLQRYRTDIFTDKYKRLSRDEPGRSITAHIAKDGYWYIHPTQHRTLSIREAARVQSFPDDFRFAGQPTHRFRQIGNAVPPLLAEALGRSLLSALEATPVPMPINRGHQIRDRLLAWRADRPAHPWRSGDADPWRVMIAELCLARLPTRRAAEASSPLWRAIPDPAVVAAVPDETRERLSGLGLANRAEPIIAAAGTIVGELGGVIPMDFMALRSIPGVGDHLAQTVLSFAGGRGMPLLDAASARVVGRLIGREAAGRWQLRPDLHRLAGAGGPDAAFNEALIELGNAVCTSSEPSCDQCPLAESCAHARGMGAGRQLDLGEAA